MVIESYGFGRLTIDGHTYTSDLKIIKGRVYPDWWRKEGHRVHLEDITDILEASPLILVIGLGASGVMRLAQGLEDTLEECGIRCIARPTGEAVTLFNEYISRNRVMDVAGAFHLTC